MTVRNLELKSFGKDIIKRCVTQLGPNGGVKSTPHKDVSIGGGAFEFRYSRSRLNSMLSMS